MFDWTHRRKRLWLEQLRWEESEMHEGSVRNIRNQEFGSEQVLVEISRTSPSGDIKQVAGYVSLNLWGKRSGWKYKFGRLRSMQLVCRACGISKGDKIIRGPGEQTENAKEWPVGERVHALSRFRYFQENGRM